jgi:site-specific DNA recombinase
MLNSPKIPGAAYIRYSSAMQDDSFSLEAQLRQIKTRAIADNVEIVKVYSDAAVSAYRKKSRPGINLMLEDAKRGYFKVLYVHKLDRLARRLEWAIEIVKQLQASDVILRSVEQKFDLDTPDGKLMFVLLGSLGEFYSDNLSQETHKGKHERAMQGYHNNQVPWGYISERIGGKKKAGPDPERTEVVRQVFERYATGLYYDQDIANWLTGLGHKTLKNGMFTKDAIREMLQSKFYIGYVNYNGQHDRKGKHHKKERVWIKGLHPPIIDIKLFEKCQRVREKRRRISSSNQKTFRVYLLAGIITCNECKRRLRAQSAASGQYYREVSRLVGVKCKYAGKSVRSDIIDGHISRVVESLVLPENWKQELEKALQIETESFDPQKEKERIKNELRRTREAYKRGLYIEEEAKFWRDIEELQAKLSKLQQIVPKEMRQAGEVIVNIREAWRAATKEEQKQICKILFKSVEYDFSKGEIVKIVPNPEYEILFKIIGNK